MDDFQFEQRKKSGIEAISICELDKSPKGSVDEPIQDLVNLINAHKDYCTTSSCSGRISLFHTSGEQITAKGRGFWLLALHRALNSKEELESALDVGLKSNPSEQSITLFKHEPFVLHVLCRTVHGAQAMLLAARESGFRESGISVSNDKKIILAVRTTSNMLEVPVAFNGTKLCTSEYLAFLSEQANVRFKENVKRVDQFYSHILKLFGTTLPDAKQPQQQQQGAAVTTWQAMEDKTFKRWGHVCVVLDSSRVLLFGGWKENARTNDTLLWDSTDSQFHQITCPCPSPPALVYHTGTRVAANQVYLFGGRTSPQAPNNELWNFSNGTWELVKSIQQRPQPRYRHAACSDGKSGRLFVYGGRGADGKALDDLWEFSNGAWTQLESRAGPGALFAHAMVASETHLYLHGGLSNDETERKDGTIYAYELSSKTWIKCGETAWRFSHNWVVNFSNPTETFLCGGVMDQCSARVLGLEEALQINLQADCGGERHLVEIKPLQFTAQDNCELLAVQHSFAVLSNDTVVVFGGGATCFAFGSVYSPSAKLIDNVATTADNANQLFVKCGKSSAVKVKKALVEMQAMDKARKVQHHEDGALCFPVLFPINTLAGCETVTLAAKSPPAATATNKAKQQVAVEQALVLRLFGSKDVKIERVDDCLLVPQTHKEEVKPEDWIALLEMHSGAKRIVQRERVDSGVMRQSRNRLLFSLRPQQGDVSCWVSKTENGVTFSWDMLQVMYSKGNVAEKLRFANLIQPGETVLDLFAGIGYFTLPALKLAQPNKVYSCELNPQSVRALRRNLVLNKIEASRSLIFPGDCRNFTKENFANRISLGLLPDARVGFKVASKAVVNGGWMHIHENVHESDIEAWSIRIAQEISDLLNTQRGKDEVWVATCHNISRVKSYSPRVYHVVGDVKCERLGMAPPNLPPVTGGGGGLVKPRPAPMQAVAEDLRHAADVLLCNTGNKKDALSLAADAEILFKRVVNTLKQQRNDL